MLADLYDFDQTVFDGESGSRYFLFCLRRHPKIIKRLPSQIKAALRFAMKKITMEEMKEALYSILKDFDGEEAAKLFWEENAARIKPWFQPKTHDVPVIVCSASPAFQIKPVCDKLRVNLLIATEIDVKTGKISGKNCKGEEKVKRIAAEAGEYTIRDVYTDNIQSDAPILALSTRNKYHVDGMKIEKL